MIWRAFLSFLALLIPPPPNLYPLPTATRSPATQCPPGQKEWRGRGRNWAGGKGRTKEGNRTGQTALAENGAERRRRRRKGKMGKNHCGCQKPLSGKLSCRCTPQCAQVSAGVGKPSMDSECASGCTWSTARATACLRANPGVVKQDKSSRGSVDTTKTRSGPQRVRMSSGERPIGAAKGKQSETEALCQPAPPPTPKLKVHFRGSRRVFRPPPPLSEASIPPPYFEVAGSRGDVRIHRGGRGQGQGVILPSFSGDPNKFGGGS